MELGFTTDDTVLVTGGSRGIGAAIINALAAEGVGDIRVVARDPGSLEALAARVRADGGRPMRSPSRPSGSAISFCTAASTVRPASAQMTSRSSASGSPFRIASERFLAMLLI